MNCSHRRPHGKTRRNEKGVSNALAIESWGGVGLPGNQALHRRLHKDNVEFTQHTSVEALFSRQGKRRRAAHPRICRDSECAGDTPAGAETDAGAMKVMGCAMKRTELYVVMVLLVSLLCFGEVSGQTGSRRRRPGPARPRPPARTPQETPRRAAMGDKNSVEFTLSYDFSIQAIPSELRFVTPIPQTTPDRQEIADTKYSHEPARVFDKEGTKYAEFIFRKPASRFKLEIDVRATLLRYDLSTAKRKQKEQVEKLPDPNVFLRSEKYIEKDAPQIQQVAKGINASNQTAIARAIYQYVTDNITYATQKEELGAVKTLQNKQGACTEYSDLFAALCRAKGIPARVVKGYVSEPVYLSQHAWAEVYLDEYGWVPFDLTYGDVENKALKDRNFENLKPIYVYLTNIRNDPILDTAITVSGVSVGDVSIEHTIEFK